MYLLGTNLEKRLARGDPGINQLDVACKEHDIAYTKSKDSNDRYLADKELQQKAMKRVFSKNASLGERSTALAVSAAMKAKRMVSKIGKGINSKKKKKRKPKRKAGKKIKRRTKRPSITFGKLVKEAKSTIKHIKPDNLMAATKMALNTVKQHGRGKTIRSPRTIKLPTYSGGVLPLIPIFAGLSALGTITGSVATVVNAINNYRNAHRKLEEDKRHNNAMESIAIGKGYYLHAPHTGNGYYLKQQPKNY